MPWILYGVPFYDPLTFARTNGTKRNGTGKLEQAITLLVQNQAAFVGDMRENAKQMGEIRKDFDIIKALLIQHERTLEKLQEAIRQKIGFKTK